MLRVLEGDRCCTIVALDTCLVLLSRLEKLDQQRSKQPRGVSHKSPSSAQTQQHPQVVHQLQSSSTPSTSRAARAALLLQGVQRRPAKSQASQGSQAPPVVATASALATTAQPSSEQHHAVFTPLAQLVDKNTLQATPLAKVPVVHQKTCNC